MSVANIQGERISALLCSKLQQHRKDLKMADILTVLWQMDTFTSAATNLNAVRHQLVQDFNNDPGFRNDVLQWCGQQMVTPEDGIDLLAQNRLTRRNRRSAFTALNSDQRLIELDKAVAKARAWASKTMGTSDLVFVAPEYLFAQDGYRHLLPFNQVANIKARLKGISKKYPQVLMFPGTVAFREPIQNNSVKARARLYEDMNFWKANGTGARADWVDSATKDKVNKIAMRGPVFDTAQNKSFAYLNGKKVMEYTKRGDFHEVTAQDATGNEVFVPGKRTGRLEAFGRSFGTEICLDHNMGYAKTASTDYPDIHVIMSAAVEPEAEHETTQGKNPGKTGFIIHASCVMEYTGVIQWSDAKRSELDPSWTDKTDHGGVLLGYKLEFNSKKSDLGVLGVKDKVAEMRARFGG